MNMENQNIRFLMSQARKLLDLEIKRYFFSYFINYAVSLATHCRVDRWL